MCAAIGQILGNAVRVAVSPLPVIAVFVVLASLTVGAKFLGDGLTTVG